MNVVKIQGGMKCHNDCMSCYFTGLQQFMYRLQQFMQ